MIIDAHLHLWNKQHGMVNGKPVYDIGGGKSDFGGVVKQMMPAYMTDGVNSVERLIANMDFAQVNAAVVVQEYIDGNQDEYLLKCKEKYPERIKVCSLYEEHDNYRLDGFDGIKICGGRLTKVKLEELSTLFHEAEEKGMFVAITYRMSQDYIIKSDKLTAKEKEKFLGLNAAGFYGFEVKDTLPYISHMAE